MAQQGLKPKSLPWNPAWAPWRRPQNQSRKRKEWTTKVQKVLLSLIITTIPWKITTSLNLWDRLGNFPRVTDKLLPSRNLFLLGVNTHREKELAQLQSEVKSLSCVQLFATPWTVACTRLLHPWDFLSKSTGVGCHFLLHTDDVKCVVEKIYIIRSPKKEHSIQGRG